MEKARLEGIVGKALETAKSAGLYFAIVTGTEQRDSEWYVKVQNIQTEFLYRFSLRGKLLGIKKLA